MASAAPGLLLGHSNAVNCRLDVDWRGVQIAQWMAHYTVYAWPLWVQENPSTPPEDLYYVQVEGTAGYLKGDSSWTLAAHGIQAYPQATDADRPLVELAATSPDTTTGSHSYTTSVGTTTGASVGFMGEAFSGSVSESATTSEATTASAPDLLITNRSLMGYDEHLSAAHWTFEVDPNSSLANGGHCAVNVAFIYRVPHGAPTFTFMLNAQAYLFGGDQHEINHAIGAMDAAPTHPPFDDFEGIVCASPQIIGDPAPFYAGKARLSLFKRVTLHAPPPPH